LHRLFDTNYHYNVPELTATDSPSPDFSALLASVKRAVAALGADHCAAVVLGPVTYLHLAKCDAPATRTALLAKLLPVYKALLRELSALGVAEIQLHEAALTVQGDAPLTELYRTAYPALLGDCGSATDINMVSYFEDVGAANLRWLCGLERVNIISLDCTRGDTLALLQAAPGCFPATKILGAGVSAGLHI
jgi:5-methyltetrahydropteroyltriglutamate--homocysteine methyltransferase